MKARRIRFLALSALTVGIALVATGCAQPPATEKAVPADTTAQSGAQPALDMAREAAQMAVAIEKEPGRLQEILAAHHMTAEGFQDLLYRIAEDPELTDAYEAARTGS